MRLNEILTVDRIVTDLDATDKQSILRELAGMLASGEGRLEGDIYRVLVEREKLVSTGVGQGIAIPHGRFNGIDRLRAAMVICRRGVAFDAIDGEPVRVFIAVLAPEIDPSGQLKTLARISRVLKDESVRQRLFNAGCNQDVLDIMTEEEPRR
jgi:PTS system nitrogen regulatory IIA component